MEQQGSIQSGPDSRLNRAAPLRNALYRAMRDAARVHALPDAVTRTAEALIDFIPGAAREPVSPVQVQRLADERGCDTRTIRNHIARLLSIGLVADRRRDGGGRAIVRDGRGAITALYGISFAPLARDAAHLAARAAALAVETQEKARLRGDISVLRRQIRLLLAQLPPGDLHETFAEGPRRFAELDLHALKRLWHRVADLHMAATDALADARRAPVEGGSGSVEASDRSENPDRPLQITTGSTDDFCNRSPIRRPEETMSAGGAAARAPGPDVLAASGLAHVTLAMVVDAAPEDWRREIEAEGENSWRAVISVAERRRHLLGVNADAWHCAVAVLGRSGAAIVVLIADANHCERGGAIKSAGGWVRAVTRRAQTGEANLCRSIFGLLARRKQLH